MRLHSCSSPWFVGDEPAPWREWYAAHGAETTELFPQFNKLMELQLQFGRHGLNCRDYDPQASTRRRLERFFLQP